MWQFVLGAMTAFTVLTVGTLAFVMYIEEKERIR